jgi:putative ABC transport system permease protein
VIYCSKDGSIAQTKISDVNQTHTIKHINNTCKNISPDFDFNYQYLENKIKTLYKSELDLKNSFQLYSIIMFIIVLLGLFSLNLFLLKKKKKEIGIRKLFGAKMHDTLLLMTRKQMWIVLFANIIAMPVTYLTMEKWLNNYPFRIDISYLIFLKTLLITIVFTILVISYLMLKVYKMNLINTLRKE